MIGVLLLVSLLVIVTLALGGRAARTQQELGGWVAHTLEVRGTTYELRASLADMERWQLLYLLSGAAADVAPVYVAIGASREQLARVRELTRDNPVQAARGGELAAVVERRRAHLESEIELRRSRGLEVARAAVLVREGSRLSDTVVAGIAVMRQTEDSLLALRQASWDVAARRTRRIQAVAGVLVVVLLAVTLAGLARLTSARRRAQQERERIITLSSDLHCIAGFDGRFRMLNPAWERTLGHPIEELLSKPFMEFIHPDDIAATNDTYEQQVRAGKLVVDFANRYRHRDGSYRWLEWRAITMQNEGLIYASGRDITAVREAAEERRQTVEHTRQLNAELEQSVEELKAANQELEAFTYTVSHDLRAPLRHISGFSELLEKHAGGALDGKGKRYLGTIGAAVARMGALIDDLLMFSRIGRAELHAGPVRLDGVVQAVLPELGQEIAQRKVRFDLRPLPVVHGDSALLRVVFANLLANALKYTRPREEPRIEVGTDAARDGRVVVFVRDNGVGFDMQYVGKVFGVFQRLHSPEEFEGTGIGLATVQRIVHKHRGLVWAEGVVEKGATFYVALPPADPTSAPGVT